MTKPETPKPPKELDAIVDVVLAYKATPKTDCAKKRKKRGVAMVKNRKSLERRQEK